jgi:hypothetical protein
MVLAHKHSQRQKSAERDRKKRNPTAGRPGKDNRGRKTRCTKPTNTVGNFQNQHNKTHEINLENNLL